MEEKIDFEYSDCLDPLGVQPNYKGILKILSMIYFYLIIAMMAGILIYSFSQNVALYGKAEAFWSFSFPFFSIAVGSLILILSAHGLWAKFMKWALKNKMYSGDRASAAHYEKLYDDIESRKPFENAVSVNKNTVTVKISGEKTEYSKCVIEQVTISKAYTDFYVSFIFSDDIKVIPFPIPSKYLKFFLKQFDCKINVFQGNSEKRVEKPTLNGRTMKKGERIGLAFFTSIPIIAGVALTLVSWYKIIDIPIFIGLFFLFGGLVAFFSVVFNESEIKNSILGLFFGCAFVAFSSGFCIDMMSTNNNNILELFISVPQMIILIMFFMLGIFFIALCLVQLIKKIIESKK